MHFNAFSFFIERRKKMNSKLLNFDNIQFEGKLKDMDTIFPVQLKDVMGYGKMGIQEKSNI